MSRRGKRKCNRIGEVAVSRPMASRRRRSQVSTSRPYAAPERSAAHGWRPFHDDEARVLGLVFRANAKISGRRP